MKVGVGDDRSRAVISLSRPGKRSVSVGPNKAWM